MQYCVDLQGALSASVAATAWFGPKTRKNQLKRQKILANQDLL